MERLYVKKTIDHLALGLMKIGGGGEEHTPLISKVFTSHEHNLIL